MWLRGKENYFSNMSLEITDIFPITLHLLAEEFYYQLYSYLGLFTFLPKYPIKSAREMLTMSFIAINRPVSALFNPNLR